MNLYRVYQLHFSTWPDHGVPLYSQSLVPFLQRILKIPLSTRSPVVVHCSAGVGRTGTVLLCDISLRRAAREGNIDLLNTIQHLREQRANMVDNIEQYKLAHLVILECLLGKQTSLPCSEIDNAVRNIFKTDEIKQQLRYLKDTAWQDQAMKTVGQTDHTAPVVAEKNRFQNILPEIQGRVFLQRYPPKDEDSSYINAIKVDGFRCPGRFIVTQQPLPNTLGDFWRLVEIYNISVVLSLNEINMEDKTSCNFYPTQGEQKLKPVDYITLQHESTVSQDCYDLISLRFMTKNIHENKIVQVVSMKNWPASKKLPRSTEEIITFWEGTNPLFRTPNPILVTCYDGATASGVYLALSFLIEKMKLEQTCDVCQAVRTIRHNREQFIDEEQFAFLYKVAVQYISGFQSYSNFN